MEVLPLRPFSSACPNWTPGTSIASHYVVMADGAECEDGTTVFYMECSGCGEQWREAVKTIPLEQLWSPTEGEE